MDMKCRAWTPSSLLEPSQRTRGCSLNRTSPHTSRDSPHPMRFTEPMRSIISNFHILRLQHSQLRVSRSTLSTPLIRTMSSNPKSPSASSNINHDASTDGNTSAESQSVPLGLPEPDKTPTTQIDMSTGGSTVKLDHMGPLVVNKDGSLSRITNWAEMSEIERQNTLRVLGKRNQLRREALQAKEGGEGK
ncbi:hypothetical protein DE146DRAFT_669122 [Phaeosphaeria sp. MPI-PUGE-AT-0046c]|nr:hypothetical protein DE146DRAFT_669122 [Phaeosphaeria sp. MPI-PUGE-AT-0046c]